MVKRNVLITVFLGLAFIALLINAMRPEPDPAKDAVDGARMCIHGFWHERQHGKWVELFDTKHKILKCENQAEV